MAPRKAREHQSRNRTVHRHTTSYGPHGADGATTVGELTDGILNRKVDVNRSGSLDEQLRFAIANKLLIQVSYGGSSRVIEPHDYGIQKGAKKLLAYQLRATSSKQRKSVSGWRLFDVSKIDGCVVLDEQFRGSRGASHHHHYVWDLLYARVG